MVAQQVILISVLYPCKWLEFRSLSQWSVYCSHPGERNPGKEWCWWHIFQKPDRGVWLPHKLLNCQWVVIQHSFSGLLLPGGLYWTAYLVSEKLIETLLFGYLCRALMGFLHTGTYTQGTLRIPPYVLAFGPMTLWKMGAGEGNTEVGNDCSERNLAFSL